MRLRSELHRVCWSIRRGFTSRIKKKIRNKFLIGCFKINWRKKSDWKIIVAIFFASCRVEGEPPGSSSRLKSRESKSESRKGPVPKDALPPRASAMLLLLSSRICSQRIFSPLFFFSSSSSFFASSSSDSSRFSLSSFILYYFAPSSCRLHSTLSFFAVSLVVLKVVSYIAGLIIRVDYVFISRSCGHTRISCCNLRYFWKIDKICKFH